jgi:hypothetical protein
MEKRKLGNTEFEITLSTRKTSQPLISKKLEKL